MNHTRSITICAYNRPHYLHRVLVSLLGALLACPSWAHKQTLLLIGIDPGGDHYIEVKSIVLRFLDVVSDSLHAELIEWNEPLGVSEHPRRLLQHVFIERRSEFNLHLEDDTVVSPDALRLAEWFRIEATRPHECTQPHAFDKVLGIALSSRSQEHCCTHKVSLRADFGVWGWGCTYFAWWLWFSHYWNEKSDAPYGFDYGFTRMMERNSLYMVAPALSRIHNIGRDGGVHETPDGWDREHLHAIFAGPDDMRQIEDFRLENLNA